MQAGREPLPGDQSRWPFLVHEEFKGEEIKGRKKNPCPKLFSATAIVSVS